MSTLYACPDDPGTMITYARLHLTFYLNNTEKCMVYEVQPNFINGETMYLMETLNDLNELIYIGTISHNAVLELSIVDIEQHTKIDFFKAVICTEYNELSWKKRDFIGNNETVQSLQWKPASEGDVPLGAVCGGIEGVDIMYVARAKLDNGVWPGKLFPRLNAIYFPLDGGEKFQGTYEVLCSSFTKWVTVTNGQIPFNAIRGGETSSGEILYVGRFNHGNTLTPGMILNGICNISLRGRIIQSKNLFDVLVAI